jgi:hypothetical protein
MTARDRRGEERAQHGRSVREVAAAAVFVDRNPGRHSGGLEVTTEATRTFDQEKSGRRRMWPSLEMSREIRLIKPAKLEMSHQQRYQEQREPDVPLRIGLFFRRGDAGFHARILRLNCEMRKPLISGPSRGVSELTCFGWSHDVRACLTPPADQPRAPEHQPRNELFWR